MSQAWGRHLTNREYNQFGRELIRNQRDRNRRKGILEAGEEERKEYVKAQQQLANAFLEFGQVALPALTELSADATGVIIHPVDTLKMGFEKVTEGVKHPDLSANKFKNNNEIADFASRERAVHFDVPRNEIPKNATNIQ